MRHRGPVNLARVDEVFAAGRTADVVDLGDGRVRRTYRDGRDATAEADLMRRVRAAGYPVPRVHTVDGPSLVLDFVSGPTLAEALVNGGVQVAEGAALLAGLHDRLHAVDRRGTADAIVHLDLHPENVVLTATGPVVLDWTTAARGAPGLDVAMTAVVLAQEAVLDTRQLLLDLRPFIVAFLAAVTADAGPYLDAAVVRRAADPMQSDVERTRLGEVETLVRQLLSAAAQATGSESPTSTAMRSPVAPAATARRPSAHT